MKAPTDNKIDYSGKLPSPPVFVVGYMHSGTTLLINILKSQSSVFSGNRETKYFMHLPMIRKVYSDLENDEVLKNFVFYAIKIVKTGFNKTEMNVKVPAEFNVQWFGDDEKRLEVLMKDAKLNRDHGAIFNLVSNHMAQSMGKSRWVEKTPTHIFHIDEMLKSVPDALFVEIVRDPRDVLASKKTRRLGVWESEKYAGDRLKKHREKAFDPLWDSLSWKSAIHAGRKARDKYPEKIILIRYEDLAENPEQKVREICDFLKMEFEPEMLNITTRNSAEDDAEDVGQTGIQTNSIGRWHKTLRSPEVGVCQWQVGEDMSDLGYSLVSISRKDKVKMPFVLAGGLFEFVRASYRRLRLGGWLYFQNVLVNYWKRVRILLFPS
ncbi:MAG: sulfotransferase [Pyrinomonadaceae bacterium]